MYYNQAYISSTTHFTGFAGLSNLHIPKQAFGLEMKWDNRGGFWAMFLGYVIKWNRGEAYYNIFFNYHHLPPFTTIYHQKNGFWYIYPKIHPKNGLFFGLIL